MTDIHVVGILLQNNGRPVKAYVDVEVGDWTINNWKIVKQNNQRAWVSVPQTSWKDQEGRVRYRALLSIPDELKQRIEVAILSAWEKEILQDGPQE